MGNGCGASLAVGQACGIQVVFAPTVAGRRTGTLTVTDSAGSSPQIEALTGTGIDFSLSPNGNTSVTVASGGSAVFPLLLASPAGVPGTAVMSCTGAPANATCVVQPASVPLGTTTTVSVEVNNYSAYWAIDLPTTQIFRLLRRWKRTLQGKSWWMKKVCVNVSGLRCL